MFGYRVLGFGAGGGVGPPINVDYLVVAGGGSGGSNQGGGGGAGGYRTSFPGGTKIEMDQATSYSITVGQGGSEPSSGANSSLPLVTTINSTGGGRGPSNPGGSGGGAGPYPQSGGSGNAGGYSPPEGNNGGSNSIPYGPSSAGGGGGGANQAGGNNPNGVGGDGSANSISGSSVTYAGGGGKGDHPPEGGPRPGGAGGGGSGGDPGQAGTDGLGGGGGAGSNSSPPGGDGGDGVIFVRIPAAAGVAAGDVTVAPGTNTVSTDSPTGDVIVKFGVTGTFQVG
jgi:hypothetical protein